MTEHRVTKVDEFTVKLALDRPGIAGVSKEFEPHDLIEEVAEVAGIQVTFPDQVPGEPETTA